MSIIDKQEKQLKSIADSLERLVKLKEKEMKAMIIRDHEKMDISYADFDSMKGIFDALSKSSK